MPIGMSCGNWADNPSSSVISTVTAVDAICGNACTMPCKRFVTIVNPVCRNDGRVDVTHDWNWASSCGRLVEIHAVALVSSIVPSCPNAPSTGGSICMTNAGRVPPNEENSCGSAAVMPVMICAGPRS